MPIMTRFDEVKASFWNPGDHGVQLPLTEAAIEDAELELGVALPASLLALLRVRNGGQVAARWNAFPTRVPTSWSDDHVPFDDLMGIGRRERTTSLLHTRYLAEEWDLPSPIVLVSGDGHCWIALDYRACGRKGDPAVVWFEADTGREVVLATNFESFIAGLTSTDGFDTSVQPV